jgi:hypothetical protein
MSAVTEQILSHVDSMLERMKTGEPLTEEDLAVTAGLAYRLGLGEGKQAAKRDRLQEIIDDLHRRFDDGEFPSADELVFAEILDQRMQWVDAMHEARQILEGVL